MYPDPVGPTLGDFQPARLGIIKAMLQASAGIAYSNFHFAFLGEPAERQRATLPEIFTDVVVGPQEDDNVPATLEGVRVGDLTPHQQALVLAAIETYVGDINPRDATSILRQYQSELGPVLRLPVSDLMLALPPQIPRDLTALLKRDQPDLRVYFAAHILLLTQHDVKVPVTIDSINLNRERDSDVGRSDQYCCWCRGYQRRLTTSYGQTPDSMQRFLRQSPPRPDRAPSPETICWR